ncbi:unnamed protein product [Darwinula stevensoni]|uniref:Uncharacterized protein n=1 Tax=Darwinula stevensoni TaxID=69355 RepID=A0A7R9A7C1_9CRUS|nr:unnamed protein product [Darwinula stevensoni]CAG0891136.1 unnamed protein product [Darwinula stevensoni]
MANSDVQLFNYDILQLSFGCGIHTVTVKTAKMIRVAGWILIVIGIVLIGLAITNIAIQSDEGCEEWCGNVLGAFFSALACIIGGSLAINRVNRALKMLMINKRAGSYQQGFPSAFPQQPAYGYPGQQPPAFSQGYPGPPPDYRPS